MVADLLIRVRRTPDRLLHPLRRRKAFAAVRRRPSPTTVLVVCHGNICRSPVAAALLARELETRRIDVQSAGLVGFNRPPPAEAVAAAEHYGLNLSNHRSRLVTPDLVRAADVIVVMEPIQGRLLFERFGRPTRDVLMLGDFDPARVEARTIRDPVNQSRQVFDQVYERIARCVRTLAKAVALGG